MKKIFAFLLLAVAFTGFSAFKLNNTATAVKADAVEITAAGATFPFPLYSKMFSEYNTKTGAKVNYQSVGSGAGIQQLMNKTVDFGASDAFLSDDQMKAAPAAVLHVPTCMGAVVLSYNIPGNPKLKLTPAILSGIFLGTITKWNDPKIVAENKGTKLPDMGIFIVHRSDGSGTSFIFTDYLSKISADWSSKVGKGTTVNWPSGLGGKGNAGVAGLVQQTPGSIGYVELIYALQNKMPFADLQNKSGKFITPALASVTAAANIALPADTRASITNTDAADGYPISSFTWLLVYKEQHYGSNTAAKSKAVAQLMNWMIHEGQPLAEPLQYAALPKAVVKQAETILKSLTWDGKPIM